jgi:hypothetical protein
MSGLGRRSALSALDGMDVDVLIVGGGISGCSAAQQLTASGYRVLVINKGDFASAASRRSSRLLHCGLRYLAPQRTPAKFLVRPDRLWTAISMAVRSLWARREFLTTTPERLRVLDMAIPIYQGAAYAGWQVDMGAAMLGVLNLGGPPLHYRRQKPEIAAAAHPPLLGSLIDSTEPSPAPVNETVTYQRRTGKRRDEDCVTEQGLRFDESVPVVTIELSAPALMRGDDYEGKRRRSRID